MPQFENITVKTILDNQRPYRLALQAKDKYNVDLREYIHYLYTQNDRDFVSLEYKYYTNPTQFVENQYHLYWKCCKGTMKRPNDTLWDVNIPQTTAYRTGKRIVINQYKPDKYFLAQYNSLLQNLVSEISY